jgi:hypothetical protein
MDTLECKQRHLFSKKSCDLVIVVGWVVHHQRPLCGDERWLARQAAAAWGSVEIACGFLFSETSVGRSRAAAAAWGGVEIAGSCHDYWWFFVGLLCVVCGEIEVSLFCYR